jgi:poly-gamma-glutamate synthesis protein (capsule biosynthesis protein)
VVQPVSYVESENGNKSLCYYSLGNYVSTQKQVECMLEGMAVVTYTVTHDGQISINEEETGVIPLVCQYTQGSVRIENIYFLNDYTEELAKKHGMYTYAGIPLHQEDLVNLSKKVFGDWEMKPYLDVISLENEENTDTTAEEELLNAS